VVLFPFLLSFLSAFLPSFLLSSFSLLLLFTWKYLCSSQVAFAEDQNDARDSGSISNHT
jgi:hypothetical protein